MSKNNHALDTEYKGGVISPPPNKVNLQQMQEILDQAKSVGYQGIEDIPLLPKHKREGFEPIPLCIPPVSQLLKSLAMRVFEGSGMANEINKRKEELQKGIMKALELSELSGQLGSGLSSDITNISEKIEKITGQVLNPGIKEGIETAGKIKDLVDSGKSIVDSLKPNNTDSNDNSAVMKLGRLPFLDFSVLGVKEKKTNNKLTELLENPEFVITKSSIDQETNESEGEIKDFERRFDDIMTKLRNNIESYPEKLKSQYFSAMSTVDVARAKDQINLNQLNSRYIKDFGKKIEKYSDVPDDWKLNDRG